MVGFKRLAVLAVALLPWASAAPVQAGLAVDAEDDIQVENNYIITLKSGLTTRDLHDHLGWVNGVHRRGLSAAAMAGVKKTYSFNAFHGYYGHFDADTVEMIRNNPDVEAVEADQIWTANALATQDSAPWGLGTLSHRSSGAESYVYEDSAGEGTFAYIIDSGINEDHVDLKGRTVLGHNAVGGQFIDQVGHGTHVAGTIGGTTYGVSKKATLVSVKIFKNSIRTATSTVLTAYNWTVADIIQKKREASSVINLSVGGSRSVAFNRIVDAAYAAGILTVAAAGNDGLDASDYSPASATNAITVGAIDKSWKIASYSNTGSTLDIFAPGTDVLSAWIGSPTATKTLSGTSMACPHIAGLVLYIKSVERVTDAAKVTERLKSLGTEGKIQRVARGSPNLIGNNGSD